MLELLKLLAKLPQNEHVTFKTSVGSDESGGGEPGVLYLEACHFVEPPEDGWETEGDYFGHPPDSPRHQIPCRESWKHEDHVIYGVSAEANKPGVFLKALTEALKERFAERV